MPVPSLTQGLVRIAAFFGGAVCLAGLFRFPSLVCQHGGGAFFIAYAVCLAVLVRPMLRALRQVAFRFCPPEGASVPGLACRLAWGDKSLVLGGAVLTTLAVLTMTLISAWSLRLVWELARGNPAADEGKTFAVLTGQAGNGASWTAGTNGALPWLALVVALVFLLLLVRGNRWDRLLFYTIPPALLAVILLLLPRLLSLGVPDAALPSQSVALGLDLVWQPSHLVQEERPAGQVRFYRRTTLLTGSPAHLSAQAASVAAPDTFLAVRINLLQALCDPRLWLAAVGQVGLALILVIGTTASVDEKGTGGRGFPDVPALWPGLLAGGLLGCLLALPAGAAFLGSFSPETAPFGLPFAALPSAFGHLPGGRAWGGLFFLLAGVSALMAAARLLRQVIRFLETASQLGRPQVMALMLSLHLACLGVLTWATRSPSALAQMDFWAGTLAAAGAAALLIRNACPRAVPSAHPVSIPTPSRLKRLLARCRRLVGWAIRWTPPVLLLGLFGVWSTHQILALAVSDQEFHLEPQVASLCDPDAAQRAWLGLLPVFLSLLLFALVLKTSKRYCRSP